MPDAAEIAVFIHILGVFALAGSTVLLVLLYSMMRRATTVQDVRVLAHLSEPVEKAFPAATLVLLLSGGYLVSKLDLHWSSGWINMSALALIASAAVGFHWHTPKMNAIHYAADDAADGPVPERVSALVNDPALFATVHGLLLVMIGIMWNMTTKPGGAEAFLTVAIAAAVGIGSAYPLFKRQRAGARGATG